MQYKGTLTRWDDEKGFGFITPTSGGRPVFVHVSALPRGRRPKINETLSYTMGSDGRGRPRAERVAFVAGGKRRSRRARGLFTAMVVVAAFFSALLAAVYLERLPSIVVVAYLAASVVSFVLYAKDKSAAKNGGWRTSEGTLHLFDLVGGWPGGLLAQRALRHKTTKQSFQSIYWVFVVGNLVALLWLGSDQGGAWLPANGIS